MLCFCQHKTAATGENTTMSDDDIPADVDLQDPYFAEELSRHRKQVDGMILFSLSLGLIGCVRCACYRLSHNVATLW